MKATSPGDLKVGDRVRRNLNPQEGENICWVKIQSISQVSDLMTLVVFTDGFAHLYYTNPIHNLVMVADKEDLCHKPIDVGHEVMFKKRRCIITYIFDDRSHKDGRTINLKRVDGKTGNYQTEERNVQITRWQPGDPINANT